MEDALKRIADEVQGHLRLGAEHRDTVELYTRRAVNQALIRCNREDVPPKMEVLLAEIVEAMLATDKAVPGVAGDPEVSSITRGDTAISYRDKGGALKNAEAFLKDYATMLRKFTRMNVPKGG